MAKKVTDMKPKTLSPEMFKEWYYQDAGKITVRENCLVPMKRIVKTYCEIIYNRMFPKDKLAELLRQQKKVEFVKWIQPTGHCMRD